MAQQHWTSRPEIDTNYYTNHRAQNVTCLATHGTKLLAGSADGRVALYDLEKRSEIATTPRDSTGHDRSIVGCSWFHDGGVFVSACCAGNVVVWDANVMKAACRFDLPALASAALSPMSTGPTAAVCAVGTTDGAARLCDARSGARQAGQAPQPLSFSSRSASAAQALRASWGLHSPAFCDDASTAWI